MIRYNLIASVDVKKPLAGYSSVTFYSSGIQISAHGFIKSEAKQIMQAIENGKVNSSISVKVFTISFFQNYLLLLLCLL